MKQDGFSLIELIVVIGISAVLMAIAMLNFNQMMRKSAIDSQVKMLYSELLNTRVQARFQKEARRVGLNSNKVILYSPDLTKSPDVQRDLSSPIEWGGASDILFDTQGLTNAPATGSKSICIQGDNPATYDSIVVFKTRIQMGKRTNPLGGCTIDNIVTQ
ncbi:pilus assembly FimT family protein [Geotalea uraniireducens]|uniref:Prepilin-type N-terminal cleavage/methylation domain-containing protein n=1 Tax=Geotalea uraniireducens (strain Rf4) TaxID=351605 RepID=A5GEZ0_GEOUR|nr:prepilin-type N-terminal cleavage/methylation domain-containing protein [Geotalea uraniireducens]ABQ25995.1 hypothetical protein Gura_1805 [Geotalea uraniireducens Rf4]